MGLELELEDEKTEVCDCCGDTTHTAWGWVHDTAGFTRAAYIVSWAETHSHPPHITFGYGAWGNGTTAADRRLVNVEVIGGTPELVDHTSPGASPNQAEVLGIPLPPEEPSRRERKELLEVARYVLSHDDRLAAIR
jgi:hypothetical protein